MEALFRFYTVNLSTKRLEVFELKQINAEFKTFSGRVDRTSATEAVDSGSIPGGAKPKTIKIHIHGFLLTFSN